MKTRSEARRARERIHEERSQVPEFQIDTPNDPVNEMAVLAAQIVDTDVRKRCTKLFPPDAFYAPEHRAIQAGLIELERRKLDYDPAVLVRLSPDADIRLLEKLALLRPDVPKNLEFHLDTLAWDWKRAQLTRGPIASLLEAIQNPKEVPERVITLCKQIGRAADEEHGAAQYMRDSKDVVRRMMEAVRKRLDPQAQYIYGIPTLDFYEEGVQDQRGNDIGGTRRIIPGPAPATINMVTAVSGSGKSTFTAHLALNLARQRRPVLFGAWEEEDSPTLELLSILSLNWSLSKMQQGISSETFEPLNPEELRTLEERAHAISKYVTFFDNPFQRHRRTTGRRPTNDDHLDIIHNYIENSGAEIFIADLWQRCLVDTGPEEERHALYRQLAIAQEQKVHVLMAHQQRAKDIEMRADKRPTREGIIGSGAWLDVCWTVFAPHLPAKWKRVPDDKMEVHILKQRKAPWPLCIEFDWNPDKGQISNGKSVAVDAKEEDGTAFGKPRGPRGGRRK